MVVVVVDAFSLVVDEVVQNSHDAVWESRTEEIGKMKLQDPNHPPRYFLDADNSSLISLSEPPTRSSGPRVMASDLRDVWSVR